MKPRLWVFAGPNGAGKSTIVDRYVGNRIPVINPDNVGRELTSNRCAKDWGREWIAPMVERFGDLPGYDPVAREYCAITPRRLRLIEGLVGYPQHPVEIMIGQDAGRSAHADRDGQFGFA